MALVDIVYKSFNSPMMTGKRLKKCLEHLKNRILIKTEVNRLLKCSKFAKQVFDWLSPWCCTEVLCLYLIAITCAITMDRKEQQTIVVSATVISVVMAGVYLGMFTSALIVAVLFCVTTVAALSFHGFSLGLCLESMWLTHLWLIIVSFVFWILACVAIVFYVGFGSLALLCSCSSKSAEVHSQDMQDLPSSPMAHPAAPFASQA